MCEYYYYYSGEIWSNDLTSSTLDFFSVTSTTSPNSENNTRNDASVTR